MCTGALVLTRGYESEEGDSIGLRPYEPIKQRCKPVCTHRIKLNSQKTNQSCLARNSHGKNGCVIQAKIVARKELYTFDLDKANVFSSGHAT